MVSACLRVCCAHLIGQAGCVLTSWPKGASEGLVMQERYHEFVLFTCPNDVCNSVPNLTGNPLVNLLPFMYVPNACSNSNPLELKCQCSVDCINHPFPFIRGQRSGKHFLPLLLFKPSRSWVSHIPYRTECKVRSLLPEMFFHASGYL